MALSSRRPLRYYLQFVPVTVNAVVFSAAAWLVWYWLLRDMPAVGANPQSQNADEGASAFRPFVHLLGRAVFWFVLALTALSILTTIAAWLHYLYLRRKGRAPLVLKFTAQENRRGVRMWMDALIEKIRRPLLGFVRARLYYDEGVLTPKFTLLGNARTEGKVLRTGILARSRMRMDDVKEYQLRGSVVFFEDMLRLFSLPVSQGAQGQFYQPPVAVEKPENDVAPKKTESPDIRIEEMRRVEGELTNYKAFESGDDVRRIVWKVYARSRDLVVRTPEMFEPYASHLYFYASFHTALGAALGDEAFYKEMLNYYKHRVYTVYLALADKEFELRYMPDQPLAIPESLSEAERHQRTIAASSWQQATPAHDYFQPRAGAVLCISSLNSADDVRHCLEAAGTDAVVYFVRLSGAFRHVVALGWLRRLIFLPPKDRLGRIRGRWIFSPTRLRLKRQEAALEELLTQWGGTVGRF